MSAGNFRCQFDDVSSCVRKKKDSRDDFWDACDTKVEYFQCEKSKLAIER